VRFRGSLLVINILIVLGLILTDVAIEFPRATLSSQARAAASPSMSEGMSLPALAGKRAKSRRQRGQADRQATTQDQQKDRTQAERKPVRRATDRKPNRQNPDRKPDSKKTVGKQDGQPGDRQRSLQPETGKAVEIDNGVLPDAATVTTQRPNVENRYIVLLADDAGNAM
jgi:hypothetical protein